MKKIFTLSTCDTSKKILKTPNLKGFEVKDIKKEKITSKELDEMKNLSGSYEAIFSRRSRNYSALGLKDKTLSENEVKNFILNDYTFLKRPVIIDGKRIFIGNQKKNIELLSRHFENRNHE